MDEETRRNRRYANTVASIAVVVIVLLVIWKEDAEFIINLVIQNVQFLSDKFYGFFPKLFLILTAYILFRLISFVFVDVIVRRIHDFYHDPKEFSAIARLLKFGVWTLFTFLMLTFIFQDNFGSVITSLGLVGFGITFALQKPILNFVGWVTISFRGIYRVGDRIKIGQARGDVREIRMMNTVIEGLIETADVKSGKTITVPNELVLTSEVENYTETGNYILNELDVSITYESDFKKAQQILYDVAAKVTTENKKILKKKLLEERRSVEQTLLDLGERLVHVRFGKRKIQEEMRKLEKEGAQLKTQEEVLEEEFRPRIRVELKDSSIDLVCHFITPYDQIKANRTRINMMFLEAIAGEKDIRIAYPHMEIMLPKGPKGPGVSGSAPRPKV